MSEKEPKSKHIAVRAGHRQLRLIAEQSTRHGLSRSNLTRYALQIGLDHLRKVKPLKNQTIIIP